MSPSVYVNGKEITGWRKWAYLILGALASTIFIGATVLAFLPLIAALLLFVAVVVIIALIVSVFM